MGGGGALGGGIGGGVGDGWRRGGAAPSVLLSLLLIHSGCQESFLPLTHSQGHEFSLESSQQNTDVLVQRTALLWLVLVWYE